VLNDLKCSDFWFWLWWVKWNHLRLFFVCTSCMTNLCLTDWQIPCVIHLPGLLPDFQHLSIFLIRYLKWMHYVVHFNPIATWLFFWHLFPENSPLVLNPQFSLNFGAQGNCPQRYQTGNCSEWFANESALFKCSWTSMHWALKQIWTCQDSWLLFPFAEKLHRLSLSYVKPQ
jgi:hypothetical protein